MICSPYKSNDKTFYNEFNEFRIIIDSNKIELCEYINYKTKKNK